jgi:hypothetical protein
LQAQAHVPPAAHEAVALVGAVQAVHEAPHELTLVFERHRPLQACVPAGQSTPLQAWVLATQAPAQRRVFAGQAAPQLVPSHVAVPPVGAVHAVHEEAPQVAGEVLLTHAAPQRW